MIDFVIDLGFNRDLIIIKLLIRSLLFIDTFHYKNFVPEFIDRELITIKLRINRKINHDLKLCPTPMETPTLVETFQHFLGSLSVSLFK